MEDLVAWRRTVLVGDPPEDPLGGEQVEDGLQLAGIDAGVAGQVVCPVGDLRSRRRDEEAERLGCELAPAIVELRHGALQVLLDDLGGASELSERGRMERARATLRLDVPDALQHELEVRRLDPVGRPLALREEPATFRGTDPARGDLVEDVLDQRVLHRDVAEAELAQRRERTDDRLPSLLPRQAVDAKQVAEEPRHLRLEPVELGERVVAHAEQHADPEAASRDDARERLGQRPSVLPAVVQHVLLELVENQVDLPAERLTPVLELIDERASSRRLDRSTERYRDLVCDCPPDGRERIAAPGIEQGYTTEGVRGLTERATDIHGFTPLELVWEALRRSSFGRCPQDMPSQGHHKSLFCKGLYTDFRAGAQFLFVLVICLMNMHAGSLVETQARPSDFEHPHPGPLCACRADRTR